MEKYITDEHTGLRYELVGDYYLVAGDDEPQERPIGIWGQRHLRYLEQHRKTVYADLLTNGKLNGYLADIDRQAQEMFDNLCQELAENWNITEDQKANDPMHWIRSMNSVRSTAREIVDEELIYV